MPVCVCVRVCTHARVVFCFQIEKVLQQGEISDCADPYMSLRDSDSSKVLNTKDQTRLFTSLHFVWKESEHSPYVMFTLSHTLLAGELALCLNFKPIGPALSFCSLIGCLKI